MHILCQQTNQKWLIELDSNDCLEIMVNKIREPQSNINCILWRQWSVWPLMGQYQLAKIAVDQTANVYTAGKGIVRCSATRYTHNHWSHNVCIQNCVLQSKDQVRSSEFLVSARLSSFGCSAWHVDGCSAYGVVIHCDRCAIGSQCRCLRPQRMRTFSSGLTRFN